MTGQFNNWVEQNLELGEGFDSSTLFILPNGAKRSPDSSWVTRNRWDALSPKQQDGYPSLCPDFVVELRLQAVGAEVSSATLAAPTDNLEELQAKMREYINNGARLGWLINPQERQVEIYRPGRETFVLHSPTNLSGEDLLPGFVLDTERIFA